MVIQPQTLSGLVRSLSGLFITKENPNGISPKECIVIACMLAHVPNKEILSKEVKITISNQLNQSYQVTTNYVNKLKKKGVITAQDKLHSIFYEPKIIIKHV